MNPAPSMNSMILRLRMYERTKKKVRDEPRTFYEFNDFKIKNVREN